LVHFPTGKRDIQKGFKKVSRTLSGTLIYIGFLLAMTYIGSDGGLNLIPFYTTTAIVVAISVAVFFPLGIMSGLKEN
jgi:hypothetical protein